MQGRAVEGGEVQGGGLQGDFSAAYQAGYFGSVSAYEIGDKFLCVGRCTTCG